MKKEIENFMTDFGVVEVLEIGVIALVVFITARMFPGIISSLKTKRSPSLPKDETDFITSLTSRTDPGALACKTVIMKPIRDDVIEVTYVGAAAFNRARRTQDVTEFICTALEAFVKSGWTVHLDCGSDILQANPPHHRLHKDNVIPLEAYRALRSNNQRAS